MSVKRSEQRINNKKEDNNEKIVFKKDDYFEKTTPSYSLMWLVNNSQKNEMEPIRLTLDPGGSTYPDLPHEGEEFGYVLSGSIQIHIGNRTHYAKKGEAFYFTPSNKHHIEAGKNGATLIWVSSPPSF